MSRPLAFDPSIKWASRHEPNYRICTRCVMDSQDPDIVFDEEGVCNYCTAFLVRLENETYNRSRPELLRDTVAKIKARGQGKPYDCVIGVSGGVDSSFVAREVVQLGLRPLAVHLDNGWNSELAVDNIQRLLNQLNIDLMTHVLDWSAFRDLQVAFLKASVPNIEIATDHAINALLMRSARQHGIRYVISGGNVRGEGIYPKSWGWNNLDLTHIKDIHRRFGTGSLREYPTLSLRQFASDVIFRGIRHFSILNFIDYNKPEAERMLAEELGWRSYGGKHYESIWTRFYQGYIMPRKFGVDKRRAHLSSLIAAGDAERDAALAELENDPYGSADSEEDLQFVMRKLELSEAAFFELMERPPQPHTAYKTDAWFFDKASWLRAWAKRLAKGL